MKAQGVAVVDYGMGNVGSVLNALHELKTEGVLTKDPDELRRFSKIILPGVGAFKKAMDNLRGQGLIEVLNEHVARGKDLLGICLGMQLMCLDSMEGGLHQGLGWIPAHVIPFPNLPGLKVPHMGWNSLELLKDSPIFDSVSPGSDVYFVHSFFVECEAETLILARTEHGVKFSSIFNSGNLYGMQFHPEKSQSVGLQLLKNFIHV